MGCACSKASQASQPGQDAEDLPRLLDRLQQQDITRGPKGDVASSSWQPTGEGDVASSSWQPTGEGSNLECKTRSSEASIGPQQQSDVRPTLEDSQVTSSSWFCCTEQRVWESELLQVASELKEKLHDPHFVAMRCDLDGSGDLDAHELKQAARVFGMRPSEEELQDLMAGQQRITKEHFAKIIADFQQTPASAQSHRVVPHSLRGMALGQLQHLEEVFVKSGWLAGQCDSFNEENAEDILAKKKFQQAPNLYALDTYVVTPMSKPGWCAARDRDWKRTIPQAHLQSSFSELLNPHGLLVHIFVSHFWGHLYSSTLLALRLWAAKGFRNFAQHPDSVVFWICLFALNQHAVAEEVGQKPMQGPFNAALAQAAGGAVMVLDDKVNPFRRIWCLFEISRLRDLQRPFELICDLGSLSTSAGLVRGSEAEQCEMQQATCEALWKISASMAQSSKEADKYCIWTHIANPGIKELVISLGPELAWRSVGADVDDFFTDFDLHMRSLLSTSLLQTLLDRSNFNLAARCCLYGALFTEEQLDRLCTNFQTKKHKETWLNDVMFLTAKMGNGSLLRLVLKREGDARAAANNGQTALMAAAHGGHEPVVKLLLEHGADVREAANGLTALMFAAQGIHEPVVKLLLEHGADAKAAGNDGQTALMFAARGGHEPVVKLLLEHGADVREAANDGRTALMFAAVGDHEPVVKLLIEHGADVTAAANNGLTALMAAARCGHEPVVKLLLEHRADVTAADNDGLTALVLAALCGHEPVVKLLLEHRADVTAADNNGATALMLAALGGHEPVVKLLIEHGADVTAAANNGVTALMGAARGGHEPVVNKAAARSWS